jgi:hypothetical protein
MRVLSVLCEVFASVTVHLVIVVFVAVTLILTVDSPASVYLKFTLPVNTVFAHRTIGIIQFVIIHDYPFVRDEKFRGLVSVLPAHRTSNPRH